jgi:hypothetical protein
MTVVALQTTKVAQVSTCMYQLNRVINPLSEHLNGIIFKCGLAIDMCLDLSEIKV